MSTADDLERELVDAYRAIGVQLADNARLCDQVRTLENTRADNARLRAVLATLPEPTIAESIMGSVIPALRRCVYCRGEGFRGKQQHAPTCPWLAVLAEREGARGVRDASEY